jgi:MFS family permease
MSTDAGESPADGDRLGPAFGHLLRATGAATKRGAHRLRQWNRRGGAGASGLATLVETHALQSAGDATVTVALAGSLFFSVSTSAARSHIALYLLITMAPFAVVAPVLGPMLDRVRHGRRLALATTMVARAVLALVVAHGLSRHPSVTQTLTLYPAALGVLVASKAYGVTRSAVVPRLLPPDMTLVQANSRLTLAGVVAPVAAGSVAAAVSKVLGHGVELTLGAAVYIVAAVFAMRLPRTVEGGGRARRSVLRSRWQMTAEIRNALRTAAALRWLSGLLLLFGAFVVRIHPIGGLSPNICLGELALGIAAGNIVGTLIGARAASAAGAMLAGILLAATVAACCYAALSFGVISVFAVAFVASAAAAVSKLALDATIQRRVDEDTRTSTFARSETLLQLAWVVGGGIGIVLPTRPGVGFSVAAAVLAAALVSGLGSRHPDSREDVAADPAGTAAGGRATGRSKS